MDRPARLSVLKLQTKIEFQPLFKIVLQFILLKPTWRGYFHNSWLSHFESIGVIDLKNKKLRDVYIAGVAAGYSGVHNN